MQLQPGTRIRDFEVIHLIGVGGMGEVYLGRDITLGREVAIKRLNPLFTQDPEFSQRFINEARIQAKLTHANIVILHSFFHENGVWYMIMEYAPGITLRELILRTGPIPEKRTLNILNQVAEALAYAHCKNIIHRDIKPGNIMVDTEHSDAVKVMDFGIARVLSEGHLTRTGTKMGTPYYMSPEQVNALKDVDQRSDVYSAGVVLYEMLSGKLPFNLDTDSDLLIPYRIVHDPIPDPRLVYEHISQATIDLLNRLTVKDRQCRPASLLNAMLDEDKPPRQDANPPIPKVTPPAQYTTPQVIKDQQTPATFTEDAETQTDTRSAASGSGGSMDSAFQQEEKHKKTRRKWLIAVLLVILVPYLIYILAFHQKNHMASEEVAPELDMVLVENLNVTHDFRRAPKAPYSLYVSRYEITQGEWTEVMGSNPSMHQYDPTSYYHPVEFVSWHDAVVYCNRRSQREGLREAYIINGENVAIEWKSDGYRLPTLAEWNYIYQNGMTIAAEPVTTAKVKTGPHISIGLFFPVSGCKKKEEKYWHDIVGTGSSNNYGIYDMDRNVSEWCWDGYAGDNYMGDPSIITSTQEAPAVEGDPVFNPDITSEYLGFRVVRIASNSGK
jgi:serine/threonine protein kinase